MATIGTRLMTWFRGSEVGRDGDGNRYFRARPRAGYTRERRWVMYNGEVEASRVPPHWHAWLHHMTDEVPSGDGRVYDWQQPHEPNRTGTAQAYRPPGSVLAGGQRAASAADYEAWDPSAASSATPASKP